MIDLTPTEELFLETLGARIRLGEHCWTFHARHAKTAKRLEAKGLINWKHGCADHSILAFLTGAGEEQVFSPTYTVPSTLEGATTPGDPDSYSTNIGEFAARWNAKSIEEREEWLAQIQRDSAAFSSWMQSRRGTFPLSSFNEAKPSDLCGTCHSCVPNYPYMLVCAVCGCKRCPHADNHMYECTGSNKPEQVPVLRKYYVIRREND